MAYAVLFVGSRNRSSPNSLSVPGIAGNDSPLRVSFLSFFLKFESSFHQISPNAVTLVAVRRSAMRHCDVSDDPTQSLPFNGNCESPLTHNFSRLLHWATVFLRPFAVPTKVSVITGAIPKSNAKPSPLLASKRLQSALLNAPPDRCCKSLRHQSCSSNLGCLILRLSTIVSITSRKKFAHLRRFYLV